MALLTPIVEGGIPDQSYTPLKFDNGKFLIRLPDGSEKWMVDSQFRPGDRRILRAFRDKQLLDKNLAMRSSTGKHLLTKAQQSVQDEALLQYLKERAVESVEVYTVLVPVQENQTQTYNVLVPITTRVCECINGRWVWVCRTTNRVEQRQRTIVITKTVSEQRTRIVRTELPPPNQDTKGEAVAYLANLQNASGASFGSMRTYFDKSSATGYDKDSLSKFDDPSTLNDEAKLYITSNPKPDAARLGHVLFISHAVPEGDNIRISVYPYFLDAKYDHESGVDWAKRALTDSLGLKKAADDEATKIKTYFEIPR